MLLLILCFYKCYQKRYYFHSVLPNTPIINTNRLFIQYSNFNWLLISWCQSSKCKLQISHVKLTFYWLTIADQNPSHLVHSLNYLLFIVIVFGFDKFSPSPFLKQARNCWISKWQYCVIHFIVGNMRAFQWLYLH